MSRTGTKLETWRSGTGKVVTVGDIVNVPGEGYFRVMALLERPSGKVEVDCYGGPNYTGPSKPGKAADGAWRCFTIDRVTTNRRRTAQANAGQDGDDE